MLTARRTRRYNATDFQTQSLLATGRRVSSQAAKNSFHQGNYVCKPMASRHMQSEEVGQVIIKIGRNVIGIKLFFLKNPDTE